MQYCENWERIQKRFLEFWARENHDRPLLKIQVRKDRHADPPVSKHATIRERWMDTEYMIQNANWQMQNTLYLGEAFPVLNPNLGPDYFAAGYGVELEFGDGGERGGTWSDVGRGSAGRRLLSCDRGAERGACKGIDENGRETGWQGKAYQVTGESGEKRKNAADYHM